MVVNSRSLSKRGLDLFYVKSLNCCFCTKPKRNISFTALPIQNIWWSLTYTRDKRNSDLVLALIN